MSSYDNSIQYLNDLNADDYMNLRGLVNWSVPSKKQSEIGIRNSAIKYSAQNAAGETVGMVRAISDGGYVCYIADVIVHPDYQNRGIGKKLMQLALEQIESELEKGDRVMICLLTTKGKEGFYASMGFELRPSEVYGAGMSKLIVKEPSI